MGGNQQASSSPWLGCGILGIGSLVGLHGSARTEQPQPQSHCVSVSSHGERTDFTKDQTHACMCRCMCMLMLTKPCRPTNKLLTRLPRCTICFPALSGCESELLTRHKAQDKSVKGTEGARPRKTCGCDGSDHAVELCVAASAHVRMCTAMAFIL